MTCRYRSKHTFAVSRSRSNKGVEATLWDVPQWSSGEDSSSSNMDEISTGNTGKNINPQRQHKRLLVFNTHLDPWHPSNRKKQIGEILGFIEATLQSIEIAVPTASRDAEDNIVGDDQDRETYDWSETGVLLVGDLNIKAGSKEYWDTLMPSDSSLSVSNSNENSHSWKDYFYVQGKTDGNDNNNDDQHTYAFQNSLVEYPSDCGRIDYVLGIQRFSEPATSESTHGVYRTTNRQQAKTRIFMPLTAVARSIRKERIGEESSDHYALLVELIPGAY
eukprot:CAMPEP_0201136810 /NCGR_PEP_ID=MMETSP0850-20130426/55080_1 /ASSEMBLY_ACC=CAM_ASM_000622 /TAXON_ID=183588 /ORGANISM="Pseudo-nitzschia fraudulenta, Strain WWA7" /LENGTH=275 /DNA_ID=CAMNT_0047408135 /DNA_START=321 /DNA_END=1148 /DNA_ORIENTATION=-